MSKRIRPQVGMGIVHLTDAEKQDPTTLDLSERRRRLIAMNISSDPMDCINDLNLIRMMAYEALELNDINTQSLYAWYGVLRKEYRSALADWAEKQYEEMKNCVPEAERTPMPDAADFAPTYPRPKELPDPVKIQKMLSETVLVAERVQKMRDNYVSVAEMEQREDRILRAFVRSMNSVIPERETVNEILKKFKEEMEVIGPLKPVTVEEGS